MPVQYARLLGAGRPAPSDNDQEGVCRATRVGFHFTNDLGLAIEKVD